ncbi:MAG: TM1812 family CRISPR-associated protein [Bacteroidia bacterium]
MIPVGKSEGEMWQMFSQVISVPEDGDTVSIDLTHGALPAFYADSGDGLFSGVAEKGQMGICFFMVPSNCRKTIFRALARFWI